MLEEYAHAELAVLTGRSPAAAASLIRDAVDLQHRHPRLWAALGPAPAGPGPVPAVRARVWKARRVAARVHAAHLSLAQARVVDEQTTYFVESLPWSQFERLMDAKIIEADPAAAEQRALAADLDRFVTTGRTSQHGLKDLVARGRAGDIVYLVATVDRIAEILRLEGDPGRIGQRRSTALGILADPVAALTLLARHSTSSDAASDDSGILASEADDSGIPAPEPDDRELPSAREVAEREGGRALATWLATLRPADLARLRPRGTIVVTVTDRTLFAASGCASCGGGRAGIGTGPRGSRNGVAMVDTEDIGPVLLTQLAALLGNAHVTVRPVVDPHGIDPVDTHRVPTDMATALSVVAPPSVYPWTTPGSPLVPTAGAGGADIDHTVPYRPVADGGPPGQTRIGNLGPLTRFGHRVKTHAPGWLHQQPRPGLYLWRTPHGYWFRVDTTGTHPLGRHPTAHDLDPEQPPDVARHAPPRVDLVWT